MNSQNGQNNDSELGKTIFWIATIAVIAFVFLGGLGVITFTLSA